MKIICANCGQEKKIRPCYLKEHNFCSSDCYHSFVAGKPSGRKSRKVKAICASCKNIIDVMPSRVKDNNFCSNNCRFKWQKGRSCSKRKVVVRVNCSTCNKEIEKAPWQIRKQKYFFCNSGCRKTWKGNPRIGQSRTQEVKDKIKKGLLGHLVTDSTRELISSKLVGKLKPNVGLAQRGKSKPKISVSMKKKWQDKTYREKQLTAIMKGCEIHPNKPETVLNNLLQNIFPNEWKFVGDGSVIIGWKNPDFVNINGQKKVIELYGDYWHQKEKETNGANRVSHFKQYGYDALIIWDSELKSIEIVRKKIMEFHYA